MIPELMGLGYHSRGKTLSELAGLAEKEEPTSYLQKALDHGLLFERQFGSLLTTEVCPWMIPVLAVEDQFTFQVCYSEVSTERDLSLGATPDMLIYDSKAGSLATVEIKSPYSDWWKQTDYTQEEDAFHLIRENHVLQVQTQLLVTGLDHGYLFYHIPDQDGLWVKNYLGFQVRKDARLSQLILENALIAELETAKADSSFRMLRNEKDYNYQRVQESIRTHVTHLKE